MRTWSNPGRRPNLGFTRRALVFFVVLAVLLLSYANSLRTYLSLQREMATAQQQIEQRSERIKELEDQLNRWNDDDYVRSQARTRLGWVMPGETGYRVIGRDGKVASGSTDVKGLGTGDVSELGATWWDRMAGSIVIADADTHP